MTTILDKTFVPFLSQKTIEDRINALAIQINKDYNGKIPIFLVVLNGAFLFASELLKNTDLSCEVSFIRLASYQKTESTGLVRQIIGLEHNLTGRDVIVLEDIVDTGVTISHLLKELQNYNPKSIAISTLLHKPDALLIPTKLDYVGFEIKNRFVVGYGLDYDGLGRNLNEILILKS